MARSAVAAEIGVAGVVVVAHVMDVAMAKAVVRFVIVADVIIIGETSRSVAVAVPVEVVSPLSVATHRREGGMFAGVPEQEGHGAQMSLDQGLVRARWHRGAAVAMVSTVIADATVVVAEVVVVVKEASIEDFEGEEEEEEDAESGDRWEGFLFGVAAEASSFVCCCCCCCRS